MQNARFLVLTGHLKEFSLADIVGIIRHQRKTGRLLIDYPSAPCIFFFKDGELVDAEMGALKGVQAVLMALSQPPSAPFNFNPLIQPSEKSINDSLQKVVLKMLGCLEDDVVFNIERQSLHAEQKIGPPVVESHGKVESPVDVPLFERKVIPERTTPALPVPVIGGTSQQNSRKRLLISAGALLLLGAIPPVAALTGVLGRKATHAVSRSEPIKPEESAPAPLESIHTPFDTSDEASAFDQAAGVEPAREKVRHSPRAAAPKKPEAEAEALTTPEVVPSAAPSDKKSAEAPAVQGGTPSADSTITVVTRVENGRVVEAYVANQRRGMEAFEASALRAARQRHFPPGTTGSEKMQIKIGKQ